MLIKRQGITRICSESDYKRKFKSLGFEIVEQETEDKEMDVEDYHTGRGWYEYEGKKYRKDDLIELLGE
jgi:hypothetical protein